MHRYLFRILHVSIKYYWAEKFTAIGDMAVRHELVILVYNFRRITVVKKKSVAKILNFPLKPAEVLCSDVIRSYFKCLSYICTLKRRKHLSRWRQMTPNLST